jgi:hypothetical protein
MSDPAREQLGPSSIRLVFLEVWIHGRRFPESQDRWDGNWLDVIVHCAKDGASVWAKGAILDVLSVARFRDALDNVYRTLTGEAVLESYEPNLKVHVQSRGRAGHLDVRVEITPNALVQGHWFEFEADQSYLPPLIDQLSAVLQAFPVRGINTTI